MTVHFAASATQQGSTNKTYTVSEPYLLLCTTEPSVRSYKLFYPKTVACKDAEHLLAQLAAHCKKKVTNFPVPSQDVTTQCLVSDIPAGDGKIAKLFLKCSGQGRRQTSCIFTDGLLVPSFYSQYLTFLWLLRLLSCCPFKHVIEQKPREQEKKNWR
jgi:hypothetical protein